MTVRITLDKDPHVGWNGREVPARHEVKEFADHEAAANWLIYDSYFQEGYTRRLVWEAVPDPANANGVEIVSSEDVPEPEYTNA